MPDLLTRLFRRRSGDPGLSCQELVELVTDYFEDALSPADRARFDAHIAGCEGCTMYLRQMREMLELLGELTTDSISPQAESELLATFRDWKAGNGARRADAVRRRLRRRAALTAASREGGGGRPGRMPLRSRRRCPARSPCAGSRAFRNTFAPGRRRSNVGLPHLWRCIGPTFDPLGVSKTCCETRALRAPRRTRRRTTTRAPTAARLPSPR